MVPAKHLDVSDLEPPEPLVRALQVAEELAAGEFLHMVHRRDPCLLRDNLKTRGFLFFIRTHRDGTVHSFIWRKGDVAAEEGARATIGDVNP